MHKCPNPKCKKVIRSRGANYCPWCGQLLHVFVKKHTFKIVNEEEESAIIRIEKKIDEISERLKEKGCNCGCR